MQKKTGVKRSRRDTNGSAVMVIQSVRNMKDPSMTLSDRELFHFEQVIKSRELDTWSDHDVSVACLLAKAVRRLEDINDQLDGDGMTLVNDKGTLVSHPLLSASTTYAGTVQALTRTLGLGASQRGIAGGSQDGRNKAERDAREVIKKASQDDLLA